MEARPTPSAHALELAQVERECADRAAAIAQRHEQLQSVHKGSLGDLHRRMAAVHRQIELRHLAAAEIHQAYAERLVRAQTYRETVPASTIFMGAVALTARSRGAAVTVWGADQAEAVVATSGPVVRAAQDAEFTLGEGPNRDVLKSGRPVFVSGQRLVKRWPSYAGALAELGVQTVAAVPLDGPSDMRLGSLAVFEPSLGERRLVLRVLRTVAEALTRSVLLAWEPSDREALPPYLHEADFRPQLHEAAYMVMAQCRCDLRNALALLRARAFATGVPVDELAAAVIEGRLRMDGV